MVTQAPCKGRGTENSTKYGTFHIAFSALSLRNSGQRIFERCHLYKKIGAEDDGQGFEPIPRHDDTSASNCSLVTFSIKIFYKEHLIGDDWQLCSNTETTPIVTNFDTKGGSYVTCLLNHLENVPMFLNNHAYPLKQSGMQTRVTSETFSPLASVPINNTSKCQGSNHILESHIFKICIGVAVVECGKVVYVGHGWRPLRSIDLFGKRISMQLFGDSCNRHDNSAGINEACVFFDINVRYVHWIPCTEHCSFPQGISNQPTPRESCQSVISSRNPSVNYNINCADEHHVNKDHNIVTDITRQLDFVSFTSNASWPRVLSSPPKQTHTITRSSKFSTPYSLEQGMGPTQGTVYVGSDSKYKITVLDINKLSTPTKHSKTSETHVKQKRLKDEHKSIKVAKSPAADVPKTDTNSDATQHPILSNDMGQEHTDTDKNVETSTGFFAGLMETVFGGNDSGDVNIPEPKNTETPNQTQSPITSTNRGVSDLPQHHSSIVPLERNPLYCLLKIEHNMADKCDKSVLEEAGKVFCLLFDNLNEVLNKHPTDITVKRVCVKPYDLGIFIFTVTIPENKGKDLEYIKNVMSPFFHLSLNAIGSISMLLQIPGFTDEQLLNGDQLRGMLYNMDLGCVMSVCEVIMGYDIDKTSSFDEEEKNTPLIPLRKAHSETAIYTNNVVSKTIRERIALDRVNCTSARDSVSVDTWMQMIKHVLNNRENSLIQITSPRTSLPMYVDQKWVIMLKHLLNSIKTDPPDTSYTEAVRFIWPSL
ncbi:AT-rich interactive domain-containing, putative [Babesia ovis]|uniref:AT-rich interactive domain-containing, putative n=1 Tax=Babesia ovis TaxID=5869 RepID=A0A9W5WVZ5_BABOV|nr:AT-rich interactive domain-containing, putative [Babesia ovis]